MNSKYLKWYQEIEKELWRLFRLFDNLCEECAKRTLILANEGNRGSRDSWCCCMIDNQVHDNWPQLNQIQVTFNTAWYKKVKREAKATRNALKGRRMPGNGPCSALGEKGCLIKKSRPITCTTQLCEKMLFILTHLNIIQPQRHAPLQIEDLIVLPDILPDLYGSRKGKVKVISESEFATYMEALKSFRQKFGKVAAEDKAPLITEAIKTFLG